MVMHQKSIRASEFDRKFDDGKSILEYLDFNSITKPGNKPKRVCIDFPEWMIVELDRASKKLGVSRQSLIKVFVSEKLKNEKV